MIKQDLKKEFPKLYKASATKMEIVDAPELNYLMIDGFGDPNNSPIFNEAIEALYGLSYTLKFMVKKGELQVDYGVAPLEGLWWADDMNDFMIGNKAKWKWTLMIMQPSIITNELVGEARKQLAARKQVQALDRVRFEAMADGLSAQVLYIGPYSGEPPTILKLHEFIKANGYQLCGKHREIYLSDMRRTAPEKLKTIIRQPICK